MSSTSRGATAPCRYSSAYLTRAQQVGWRAWARGCPLSTERAAPALRVKGVQTAVAHTVNCVGDLVSLVRVDGPEGGSQLLVHLV